MQITEGPFPVLSWEQVLPAQPPAALGPGSPPPAQPLLLLPHLPLASPRDLPEALSSCDVTVTRGHLSLST